MLTLLLVAALLAPAQDADSDLALLQSVNVAADGPGLLAFFRERVYLDRPEIKKLARRLGDVGFSNRENASKELIALGRVALTLPARDSPGRGRGDRSPGQGMYTEN